MCLRSGGFHQYEMLYKITLVRSERVEPRYLGTKEYQSMIPSIIQRSTGYRKDVEEES